MKVPRVGLLLVLSATCSSILLPSLAAGWQRTVPELGRGLVGIGSSGTKPSVVALAYDTFVTAAPGRFAVLNLLGANGAEEWRYDIGPGSTTAVAVDSELAVVAAGVRPVGPLNTNTEITVVKLGGGAELWRRDLMGDTPGLVSASGVALDAADDVFVSGTVYDSATYSDAAFFKLSGTDGSEIWRHTIDGGFDPGAFAVAVDPSGDVIGAASLLQPGTFTSTIVKLSGGTGSEIWRKDYPDGNLESPPPAIVVTDTGDVAAESSTGSVFMLSGADGSELWRREGSDQFKSLAMPRLARLAPNAILASDLQFGVVALDRTDGHELWRHAIGCQTYDRLDAMTVDAAGDVVVAGSAAGCTSTRVLGEYVTFAKLSGADGTELWRRSYNTGNEPGFFAASALAVAPAGDVAAAGFLEEPAALHGFFTFSVLGFSDSNGALMLCGDGYMDPGEQCDDGNTEDGDCCSSTCRSATDGTPCNDGNHCTTEDTCLGGSCRGGPALPCEPCGTCDPSSGCLLGLPFACRTPTETDKAIFRLEKRGARGSLIWDWASGAATSKKDFGDPRATDGYALCVYSSDAETPPVPTLLLRATAPAGASCSGTGGCWRPTPRGFTYRSRSGTPDGLSRVSLRAGGAGKAKLIVKGGGPRLDAPVLPITGPVTVQVRKIDGSPPCWSATHTRIVRNRSREFRARGN